MKLAIYRAIKCGTEYNARKPPTIVAFAIIVKARHRFFRSRSPIATRSSKAAPGVGVDGTPFVAVRCGSSPPNAIRRIPHAAHRRRNTLQRPIDRDFRILRRTHAAKRGPTK